MHALIQKCIIGVPSLPYQYQPSYHSPLSQGIMRALLFIILLLAAPELAESRRRMRNTFEIEKIVKVPDYCKDYYQSTSGKL